jgi:hypothetical protein
MLQPCRGANLRQEALGAEGGAEVFVQDFHGNLAVVPHVAREVHGRHAAGAKLAAHDVTAGQGACEAVGHGTRQGDMEQR